MELSHVHHRLLFISILSLAVSSPALFKCIAAEESETNLSPDSSPNSQPLSSPTSSKSDSEAEAEAEPPEAEEPELSPAGAPTTTSLPPLSHVSLPPSASDPPAESISLSGSALESPDGVETSFSTSKNPPMSEDVTGLASSLFSVDAGDESPKDVHPELKNICESTDYPSLCVSTISPLVGKGKVDVKSVLGASMDASNEVAKFGFSMAKKLANSPSTPHDLVTILNNCKDSYDDALYNFEQAKEAFDTDDVGTVKTMLSAIITDVGDCEDEFSGANFDSPLLSYAEKLTNMTSNCLAIVSLVK